MFAKLAGGHSVFSSLIVGFECDEKVNRKMLGCDSSPSLCLKNGQIGPSGFRDGPKNVLTENCPQTYPPKM
jgi:hypothetical protein